MTARVTRSSQRSAATVEIKPVTSTSRRRQRKISGSSEQSSACENDSTAINVTPPKIGKFAKDPQTQYSPSSLINRLQLCEGEPDARPRAKIDGARKVLNIGETENLYGREKELAELEEFLESNVRNKTSASMYISGQPGKPLSFAPFRAERMCVSAGTGKTACMRKLLQPSPLANKFTKVYINCTSLQTPATIYKAICAELCLKAAADKGANLAAIHKYICAKSSKTVLIVLDEIDELIDKKQSVLYSIFEWPTLPKSKIILIGIANSLDLTNRALARLQTQSNDLKPRLVHFAPYTKQQIIEIFKNRLEEAGALDVFPLASIQLLSAKVAAMSGDVRKALDIGRRVVEMAKQQPSGERVDLSDLGVTALDGPAKPEKVELKQVMNVLNSVYNTANTLNDESVDSFPLQEKILICTLLLMLKTTKNKDITVGRLHGVYAKVCAKRGIPALGESEFIGVCSLIETKGIIRIIKNKVPRLAKIQLQWDQEEITRAIKDKQLIANILSDTSLLDK